MFLLALASEFNVRMFADDTNLTMVSDNYLSLQTKVNCEIQKIDNWLKSNKLSLNYNKTEYMIVTSKKEKCKFRINIGGHEISPKECIRYLGVMLDGKKSVVYWGPKIWQEVPPDIKSKPLPLFKKNMPII